MGVDHQLLIGTQVEQPAGGVIRARGKGIAVGEELKQKQPHWGLVGAHNVISRSSHLERRGMISILSETYADGINVRLVAGESLSAHALSDIPEFSGGIASTRDE